MPEAFGGKVLWEDTQLNISQLISDTPALNVLYGIYKAFASMLLLGLLLAYFRKVAAMVLGDTGAYLEEVIEENQKEG